VAYILDMKQWSDPEVTDQVAEFYAGLSESAADEFDAAVERLSEVGPTLGRPLVGEVDLRDYPAAVRATLPYPAAIREAARLYAEYLGDTGLGR
jgi:hypothetical protein